MSSYCFEKQQRDLVEWFSDQDEFTFPVCGSAFFKDSPSSLSRLQSQEWMNNKFDNANSCHLVAKIFLESFKPAPYPDRNRGQPCGLWRRPVQVPEQHNKSKLRSHLHTSSVTLILSYIASKVLFKLYWSLLEGITVLQPVYRTKPLCSKAYHRDKPTPVTRFSM